MSKTLIVDLITLGASAGVVLFMLGVGWLLGFGKNIKLDRALIEQRLADYEPGARLQDIAIDDKGRAALARLTDGRLLIARVMGDSVTLRIVTALTMKLRISDGKISARFADLGFPSLNMALSEPPAWLTGFGE